MKVIKQIKLPFEFAQAYNERTIRENENLLGMAIPSFNQL